MTTNSFQIGGDHYQAEYQCWDFAADIDLQIYLHPAIKYLVRHKKKDGIKDLQKALHYLNKELDRQLCTSSSIYPDGAVIKIQDFKSQYDFDEFESEIFDNIMEYRLHAQTEDATRFLDDAIQILREYISLEEEESMLYPVFPGEDE